MGRDPVRLTVMGPCTYEYCLLVRPYQVQGGRRVKMLPEMVSSACLAIWVPEFSRSLPGSGRCIFENVIRSFKCVYSVEVC